jgi:predicted HicB family RNase H-like nuclease
MTSLCCHDDVMDLTEQVAAVAQQLVAAAALGDERTRDIAGALAPALQAAVRVAILDALSTAALELTEAFASTGEPAAEHTVSVQLAGDTVHFAISTAAVAIADEVRPDDGEASARISLRLPESLKAEIESAASSAEISVNSWLLRAAGQALRGSRASTRKPDAHRMTGWVTG